MQAAGTRKRKEIGGGGSDGAGRGNLRRTLGPGGFWDLRDFARGRTTP